jgi:peroxiredoxin
MSAASSSTNMSDPSAPGLRAGDKIPVFSLPDTTGSLVSSTVLLELGPLIVTFYRGIWCPYCREDQMTWPARSRKFVRAATICPPSADRVEKLRCRIREGNINSSNDRCL